MCAVLKAVFFSLKCTLINQYGSYLKTQYYNALNHELLLQNTLFTITFIEL